MPVTVFHVELDGGPYDGLAADSFVLPEDRILVPFVSASDRDAASVVDQAESGIAAAYDVDHTLIQGAAPQRRLVLHYRFQGYVRPSEPKCAGIVGRIRRWTRRLTKWRR